jgi:hypothetical protein
MTTALELCRTSIMKTYEAFMNDSAKLTNASAQRRARTYSSDLTHLLKEYRQLSLASTKKEK